MNNYKSGFQLSKVFCANCAFDNHSLTPEDEITLYLLKEDLFESVEKLHDQDVQVQSKKYKCTGRKLLISFAFAVQEI